MNIEDKIKKKENRKKQFKRIWLPLICTLIIVSIILSVVYFLLVKGKNDDVKNEEINSESQQNEVDDNQILGTNIGKNKILYKDYIYTYSTDMKISLCRRKNNEEETQEVINDTSSGSAYENIAIYKDKIM